ncbi:MAG: hypothetical protein DCC55_10085 [Chloroflexi bacterium]|nr:MAG: hypothetical protein DCC55_10085 [Chloroflexota bacterium]
MNFIATVLVTTVSLLILSRLPLGIEIRDATTALITALVFGVLNGIFGFVFAPLNWITFGLFAILLNIFVFWLTSKLVDGFRLQGALSVLIGPLVLSLLNTLIFWLVGR